jgi:long-chain acyl-CoA synthetase
MTRQRTEIEGAIAGRTLCDELRQVAETSGDAWAYSDEAGAGGDWRSLTWSQVRPVLEVAAGLPRAGARRAGRADAAEPQRACAGRPLAHSCG